jgi:uncharacterized Ntn-hydrolase superfamily protein
MRYFAALLLTLPLFLPDAVLEGPLCATFSIVCRDPDNGDFGVGVTTMPRGVRRLCPFARKGVGAVATQARVNVRLGPRGLDLMEGGKTPKQALDIALSEDRGRDERQLAMIDGKNPPAAFTGKRCMNWAGEITGKHYSTQGNILVSRKTLEAVAKTFEETPGSLAGRILAALKAGKAEGGDRRGHNSCGVIVASKRTSRTYLIDLREDNDPNPVRSVTEKFMRDCKAYFQVGDRELKTGDSGADVKQLEEGLATLRFFKGDPDDEFDAATEEALKAFQKKKRLRRTGIVDLGTARAFLKEMAREF